MRCCAGEEEMSPGNGPSGKLPSRREFLGLGASGLALLGAVGCGSVVSASGSKQLTLGNIRWDEDVALNSVLLEERFGYEVELQLADTGAMYEGVNSGDLDAFMDTWLPSTQEAYWRRYEDKVTRLAPWYEGSATTGLAVPDYVEARSIADLNEFRADFGGRITGIEADAGEMGVVKGFVIPRYELDYTLEASTTPEMLSALEKAVEDRKPIVVTAWQPHWMFDAYPIRYLEDPKGLMGEDEQVAAIAGTDLQKSKPEAYAMIRAVRLDREQLVELEREINEGGPEKGARDWLNQNQSVVRPWIEAAQEAGE